MTTLNDQQRKFYENTLTVTKQEISDLDRQIEEEQPVAEGDATRSFRFI